MNMGELLARLDRLFSLGAQGIQTELDDLVAKYGHGIVQHVRYVKPGDPVQLGATTLALRSGDQDITIEIGLAPVAAMVLSLLLRRF